MTACINEAYCIIGIIGLLLIAVLQHIQIRTLQQEIRYLKRRCSNIEDYIS